MLKIHQTTTRDISGICTDHFNGIKPYLLRRIRSSKFNKKIKSEIKNRLQDIITGSPSTILFQEKQLYRFILTYRSNRDQINSQLRYIFDYSGFVKRRPDSNWNAYKLAEKLKVNTCVYCNRQYTFTIRRKRQKVTRPQFDHFFSQTDHPLLRLSFYNLIPCCAICNLLKSDEKFTTKDYLHPYENGYGNVANFSFIPNDYLSLIGRSNNLSIKLIESSISPLSKKINRQKELFELEDIYQEHSDYVQEIIWKSHISQGQYFKWLQSKFGNGISKDEIYRLALGNYMHEKEFDKRVLSKLTKDISKEVKLL